MTDPNARLTEAGESLADALTALAESLIRAGADPEAVKAFVDGELARIEGQKEDAKTCRQQ